jgi:lysozyme family protein
MFEDAFAKVIDVEKGFVIDSGGATMYGITEAVARAHDYMGDMRDLTLNRAKVIAKIAYWDKFCCDEFHPLVAFQIFDTAYNGGYIVKWLQLAANIAVDGIIGNQTIAAVNAMNPLKIVLQINSYRLNYLVDCKEWGTDSAGWTRRIAANLMNAAK